jgi:hypothetical protein
VGSMVTIWFSRFPIWPVHAGLLGLVANVVLLVSISVLAPHWGERFPRKR